MKSLDLFMSRLMPWVAGCPDPLAREALIDSAIEFCDETRIVKVICKPQTATANVGTYTLALPQYSRAVVTTDVWYGITPLNPALAENVTAILAYVASAGGVAQQTGIPNVFYELAPAQVGLYPVPDTTKADMISARVAIKPTRDAQSLDDLLYFDWVEAIVAGAKQRLHALPNEAFSNDAKAMEADRDFRYYINRAKDIAKRGRVQGSLAVKRVRF